MAHSKWDAIHSLAHILTAEMSDFGLKLTPVVRVRIDVNQRNSRIGRDDPTIPRGRQNKGLGWNSLRRPNWLLCKNFYLANDAI
jgi:hypothetical protein